MHFAHDQAKKARNPKVHDGVTFEEAETALLDPYALTREDRDAEGEQRFVTLGMSAACRLLVAVYTYRAETIRLISAWKANDRQRRRYEQQFR